MQENATRGAPQEAPEGAARRLGELLRRVSCARV
jgi:hypothetical protein